MSSFYFPTLYLYIEQNTKEDGSSFLFKWLCIVRVCILHNPIRLNLPKRFLSLTYLLLPFDNDNDNDERIERRRRERKMGNAKMSNCCFTHSEFVFPAALSHIVMMSHTFFNAEVNVNVHQFYIFVSLGRRALSTRAFLVCRFCSQYSLIQYMIQFSFRVK